jgi:anaerobic selenocysteine-containing dehydrogenase
LPDSREIIRTTCPRDCYDSCGIAVVKQNGRGPSLLWLGQALQRQRTGGNVIRACALLPAVTGNLGKPGAGLLYLNMNFNAPYRYLNDPYLTAPHLAAGPLPRLSHMDLPTYLEDPARARALVCWNMNLAASSPRQARLRKALARGVALSPKGRWPKREPARANVNVLNPGHKSDMGENTCVHGVEVLVTPSSRRC